jgi:hypothetical protein
VQAAYWLCCCLQGCGGHHTLLRCCLQGWEGHHMLLCHCKAIRLVPVHMLLCHCKAFCLVPVQDWSCCATARPLAWLLCKAGPVSCFFLGPFIIPMQGWSSLWFFLGAISFIIFMLIDQEVSALSVIIELCLFQQLLPSYWFFLNNSLLLPGLASCK